MHSSLRLPPEVRAAFAGARIALALIAVAAVAAFAILVGAQRKVAASEAPAPAAGTSVLEMSGQQLRDDLGMPVRTFMSERLGVPKGFCRTYVREGIWMIILCTPRSEEADAKAASPQPKG